MKKGFLIISAIYSFYAFADVNFSKTIKARSHSVQENILNSEKCAKLGATDITDTMDLKLSANASNVTVCYSPDPEHFKTVSSINNNLNASYLGTEAPNGTVPYGPYWIRGTASYSNASIGSRLLIGIGVPENSCGVAGGDGVAYRSGSSYITATCSYAVTHGAHQSYTEATLEQLSSKTYGTVVVQ
jgi:hypothetical protein